jgi:hypothetical protein
MPFRILKMIMDIISFLNNDGRDNSGTTTRTGAPAMHQHWTWSQSVKATIINVLTIPCLLLSGS